MTTFTATRGAATLPGPFKAIGGGIVCAAYGTIAVAVDPVPADVYEMCWVPAGAVILGGNVYAADLDTDASETLDFDLGWAANGGTGTYDALDADGLGNFGVQNGDAFASGNVSNVAGINLPLAGLLVTGVLPTFTKNTKIQITCIDDTATFTAGSISVVVYYVVP